MNVKSRVECFRSFAFQKDSNYSKNLLERSMPHASIPARGARGSDGGGRGAKKENYFLQSLSFGPRSSICNFSGSYFLVKKLIFLKSSWIFIEENVNS